MRIHQVLSGAGPVDAVTRQALTIRERLAAWGHDGGDHAAAIDPRIAGRITPLRDLRPAPGDLLLLHYSAYAPRLRRVLELPNRTLLLSHNVTPARWFWDHDPTVAVHCALGRRQLPEYAARADLVAGVSLFNARELGSDLVIPIVFDPPAAAAPAPADPPELLFVGRLAPHKRQDLLIRPVALLRRTGERDLRLRLVGEPLNPRYLAALRDLADRVAPGAVVFEHGVDDATLHRRYAAARAFVCLSEHEGFCIPLLEAFHHGVPVVARPLAAVPETAADAALLVPDDDLGVLAEAVRLVLHDDELRAALQRRGRARVGAYTPAEAEARLQAAVRALSRA